MRTRDTRRVCVIGLIILCLAADAWAGKEKLEVKTPSQGKESLIWNVSREITGFKVEVLDGNPIINTIRFLGIEDFQVGAYFSKGQSWEKKLDKTVSVGQLRVNVDKAQGSRLQLTVYTAEGGGDSGGRGGSSVKRPEKKQESLIWDVNQEIRGFEVFVREGKPIINTIKILGGEEFHVGAYMEKGRSFRKDFDERVRVGQLRVNVDQAVGSAIELKTWR